MSLDRTEDRWRTLKTNPVNKSAEGWESFRAKTDNGRRKRPAVIWNRPKTTRKGR
jgi:hypothetical protein